MTDSPQQDKPTIWDVIKSVGAAFFGVQNDNARQRDFSKGNPLAYIIVGIVLVTLFVFSIIGVVKWVVSSAGIH